MLITNHVHLLIEITKEPFSKIMQLINFTYTHYFNKKYGKVELFSARYNSFLCERDEYLLCFLLYIHLNPVRARMVNESNEYKCRSHNDYIAGRRGFIDNDRALRMFSERTSQALRLYREFVKEAMSAFKEEALYKAAGQQILGDERFIEKIEKKLEKLNNPIKKPTIEEIFTALEE